jgi:hypothetical protein
MSWDPTKDLFKVVNRTPQRGEQAAYQWNVEERHPGWTDPDLFDGQLTGERTCSFDPGNDNGRSLCCRQFSLNRSPSGSSSSACATQWQYGAELRCPAAERFHTWRREQPACARRACSLAVAAATNAASSSPPPFVDRPTFMSSRTASLCAYFAPSADQ